MQEIILDAEFKRILPKLDTIAYNKLEQDILVHGCLIPLVLWNGILIDGYHRFEILQKHDLPFNTISMEFNSREEVTDWVIEFQIAKRNLTPMQLSYYRGYRYELDKMIVTNLGGRNQFSEVEAQNELQPKIQSTARRLANQHNVSPATIKRDAQLAIAINKIGETSPEVKMDILSGKTRITRKQLKELTGGTDVDVTDVVAQIVDGSFKNEGSSKTSNAGAAENMQPWEKEFAKMNDEFRKILRTHAKTDDTTSVRSALRQYITMLEDLYKQI